MMKTIRVSEEDIRALVNELVELRKMHTHLQTDNTRLALANRELVKPIPMFLTCPSCGTRHVDVGEFATTCHHTHSCQGCGLTWRPAVVPTIGVEFLPGFKNVEETPKYGEPRHP